MVDCQTSSCVWSTLEKVLASPLNSRIMQLYGSFQDLWQGDASITTYMQHVKSLFDELVVGGRPLSLEDFNLYILCGLHGEFKDLITSLVTKAEPLLYANHHNHLLTHEFMHKSHLPSWLQIHLCCPHHLCCPLLILPSSIPAPIFSVTEFVLAVVGAPLATGTIVIAGLIFLSLIPLLPRTWSRVIGSSLDDY